MTPSTQRAPEANSPQDFRHNLQLLDAVASWHVWGAALMCLLLPGTILLLSFPSVLGLPLERSASLLVGRLLAVLWVASVVTLFGQRRRLTLLRQGLIHQTDAATKHRVRGEQFYGLSILDPLTALYNRRFGETRLEEEIQRAKESGDPLLLLAIDFDRFKQINDTYGHAAGDLALKEFARRLQRAVRACDVPIRVGGDEFLVMLPDCPPDKVQAILSRMDSIAFTHEGNPIPVNFSLGMAQYQANDTPETMIKRADERLYAAKAARKRAQPVEQSAPAAQAAAPTSATPAPAKDSRRPPVELHDTRWPAAAVPGRVRRGPRIPKKIEIQLMGSDLDGKVFSERTNTVELSRHGAGIVSRHKLAPEQEMIIRRRDTNKEAEVRIVRVVGSQSKNHTYGLAFLSTAANLWGAEFPSVAESAEAIRSLFECARCNRRETVYNSGASDSHAGHSALVRSCKRCQSETSWVPVSSEEAAENTPLEPASATR